MDEGEVNVVTSDVDRSLPSSAEWPEPQTFLQHGVLFLTTSKELRTRWDLPRKRLANLFHDA